jgi:hypothetical protein
MDKEIATLEGAGTCSTIARSGVKNMVCSKWVVRINHKSDGTVEARLVARGITQVYGVDCFGTYSPIAKMASFRVILAIAARHNWDIKSFDFNGAYPKGTLNDDEEIYMQEPPGYATQGGALSQTTSQVPMRAEAGWQEMVRGPFMRPH